MMTERLLLPVECVELPRMMCRQRNQHPCVKMLNRRNLNCVSWLVIWLAFMTMNAAFGQSVILHLRNGDRIKGSILSENTNAVTLSTVWIKELAVPLAEIEKREILPVATISATNANSI